MTLDSFIRICFRRPPISGWFPPSTQARRGASPEPDPHRTKTAWCSTMRLPLVMVLALAVTLKSTGQIPAELRAVLEKQIGLTPDMLAAINGGSAIVRILPSTTPALIFVVGAV